MPISPRFLIAPSLEGVTTRSTRRPSRCTTTGMRWPAFPTSAHCISSSERTGRPSTAVTTSPTRMPATSAGIPGTTRSTAVDGWG
jgi:hypothetical protein